PESGISITVLESKMPDEYISKSTVEFRRLENPCPRPILPKNFKILKSSSKQHVTSLSEQLAVKYHIRSSEFSEQQQLLFTGTSSCSAPWSNCSNNPTKSRWTSTHVPFASNNSGRSSNPQN
ncbi:hypothetical protein AVEN_1977-1, partial [Araneus ventricosus]